jgi:regulator of protease activity HflC (stomatin/prohibitin superfamily)
LPKKDGHVERVHCLLKLATAHAPIILVLLLCTDALETVANGNPVTLTLAKKIQADVAENRAIMEALRQSLLEETREEAAASGSRLGCLILSPGRFIDHIVWCVCL